MGLPDAGKEFPKTAESSLGAGKDLPYGRLAGRAAADLGLAQVLATGEAQRSQQLEAAIRGKLHQFESQIQRQSQSGASSDLGDIKFELKVLAEWIARTEYSVQQAQAHAVSQSHRVEEIGAEAQRAQQVAEGLRVELATLKADLGQQAIVTAQSAQLRDGMMSELAALQSELAEERASGARIDSVSEELSVRIDIGQNQPGDNIAMLESRDAEIAEIKTQVQNLSRSASLKSATPAAPVNRVHAPIDVTVGLSGMKAQTDTTMPALKSAAVGPNKLLHSSDAVAHGSEDQKKHLQRRMSADIERVRTELKKRAHVSR